MINWRRLMAIALLSVFLTSWLSPRLNAEIVPSQLVRQAQSYYHQGEFERSLELLERAKVAYQKEPKYLQQAQILVLTSLVQQELNLWDLAEENLIASRKLLLSIAPSQNTTQVLAQIWHSQGQFEFLRGNDREALEYWREAEKSYRQIEDSRGIVGSLLSQSRVLSKMGFFSRACDRVFVALDRPNYDCDNLTPEQIDNVISQIGEFPQPGKIEALNLISEHLLLKGNLAQAEIFIQASQTINKQLPNPSPIGEAQTQANLANLKQRKAFRSEKNGENENFTVNVRQAIKHYRQLYKNSASSKTLRSYKLPTQLNLLALLIDTENWSEAQTLAAEIELNFSTSPSKEDLETRLRLAKNLTTLKKQVSLKYSWQEIADLYLKTIQQAEAISAYRIQSYGWGYLSILQIQQNLQLNFSPQQSIQKAISLAEKINAPEIAYRWYWQQGKIYYQQEERDKAISSYQSSLEALNSLRKDVTALTKELRYDFYEQVEPIYKEYAAILLDSEQSSESELALALDAIESLQVAELDNYFQDPCVIFDVTTIDRVDKNAAAIYTLILPDRLEVIMTRSNPLGNNPSQILRRHTEFITEAELTEQIDQLRQYITEPDLTNEVQKIAANLYDLIIRPFEKEFGSVKPKNLVFILDTSMQTIPMSVLYDGNKYLLEKYAISITPGLRFLNLQAKATKNSYLAGGIARSLEVQKQKFSALKNVESELKIFKENDDPVLADELFTPANLLDRINFNSASHIHIATHGQFSSNPNKTFLLMWERLLTIKEFSKIFLQRDRVTSIPIDLLVLSACETASGDKRAALGLAGVAVRSGALSTLATLWRIDDESTAVLMDYFYEEFKKGRTKAEALREAQMRLWETTDKDWKVPAFWSAYVTIGNWK